MNNVEKSRVPGASQTKWNFHSCAVSSLYDNTQPGSHSQTIVDGDGFDPRSQEEADGFLHRLGPGVDFLFLESSHVIVPCGHGHVVRRKKKKIIIKIENYEIRSQNKAIV